MDMFGDSGSWCWIKRGDSTIYYLSFFYGFILFVMIFNCCGIFYIYRYLKRLQNFNIIKSVSLFNKLRLYPIILTILWSFPIFNRFSAWIFGYNSRWTSVMHISSVGFIGFVNMVLYSMNPKVKKVLKDYFTKGREIKKEEEQMIDMQNMEENKEKNNTEITLETEDEAI